MRLGLRLFLAAGVSVGSLACGPVEQHSVSSGDQPLTMAPVPSPVRYQARDLGVLAGDVQSAATGINAQGVVAGNSFAAQGGTHPFVSDPVTGLRRVPNLDWASAINTRGDVVGYVESSCGDRHAAVAWSDGSFREFGLLEPASCNGTNNDPYSEATAINDHGIIVGTSWSNMRKRAFVTDGGPLVDLGSLYPDSWTEALGINNRGQIVGDSIPGPWPSNGWPGVDAFVYQGGVMTDLGKLSLQASLVAINLHGVAVGTSTCNRCPAQAMLSDPQGLHLLVPNSYSGAAAAINNYGEVVGAATLGSGASSVGLVFHWWGGQLTDLNQVTAPPRSDVVVNLIAAMGINDAGQIAATGLVNGVQHALRLDPIDRQGIAIDVKAIPRLAPGVAPDHGLFDAKHLVAPRAEGIPRP